MRPQEFLIGIRDFFAVIVPGAIFLFLLPTDLVRPAVNNLTGVVLFGVAIAAYLAGSVASALGSRLDFIVDTTIESRRFRRYFAWRLAAREDLADALRIRFLKEASLPIAVEQHPESIKSFWWNHLRLSCPSAMTELDRLEATSKLFRSLVAVFSIWAVIYLLSPNLRNMIGAGPTSLVGAAIVSIIFYASGRYIFLGAVYQLGAAYAVTRVGENGR